MAVVSPKRSRYRSLSILVGGGGFLLAARLLIVPLGGCAAQETQPAPDAARPPCEAGVFKFGCDPIPDEQPGCNTDDGTSPLLARLPRATRYPVDCVANLPGDRDEAGNCRLDAVCKCIVQTLTPPPPDAGDDAGAPAPTPISAPAWSCYP